MLVAIPIICLMLLATVLRELATPRRGILARVPAPSAWIDVDDVDDLDVKNSPTRHSPVAEMIPLCKFQQVCVIW